MSGNSNNSSPTYTISSQQNTSLNHASHAQATGNLPVAEAEYRKLIAQNIGLPYVYSQLALICAMTNRLDEAKSLWLFTLKIESNYADALFNLGNVFKHERNFPLAIEYYRQVITDNPIFSPAHLNLSISLMSLGNIEESEKACRAAISTSPDFIQAKHHLGNLLVEKGQLIQGQQVFNDLLKENSQNVEALYALANIFKSQGDLDKASNYYERVMIIQPDYTPAHASYASIHKYLDKADPHLVLMQKQNNNSLPEGSKIQLSFALAKALEDVKDFSQAFIYLNEGNRLRYDQHRYTIDPDKLFIDNIIKTFTKDAIDKLNFKGQDSSKPIFIVGMPRSGSTLVEKILATHTEIYGAGELDYFFKKITQGFLSDKSEFLFRPLNDYCSNVYQEIGKTYLEQLNRLNNECNHITDKLPFNMLFIGLIKIIYPNAKIIHCVRDPIDNCLSIFKKNFATDNYRFAFNLKTIGQYHNQYRKLMKHWHLTFPGQIYDIQYENLAINPEDEMKKLISACHLDWQDECLNFDKSNAIIKTASAYQVRQPMYTSSVNLWKNYEKDLQPLISVLDNKEDF